MGAPETPPLKESVWRSLMGGSIAKLLNSSGEAKDSIEGAVKWVGLRRARDVESPRDRVAAEALVDIGVIDAEIVSHDAAKTTRQTRRGS